jgi:type II secretory pathway pseudopilin PulG
MKNYRGVTMLEIILVVVIIAIAGGFSIPGFRQGVINREAKSALNTLKNINQAVRMYAAEYGAEPASITVLESKGFLKNVEYTKDWVFEINTAVSPFQIHACKPDCGAPVRDITIARDPNNPSKDIVLRDYPVGLFCDTASGSPTNCAT